MTKYIIIIPLFEKINYEKYSRFAKISLLQQANGQIITSNPGFNINQIISDLSLKYNTVEFDVYKCK